MSPSKNPKLQKFAESNGPVPAQGRIYVYDDGPMITSPGIIGNCLVLGLRFHRFWPNVCSNEHTSEGETNSRFTNVCSFEHTIRRGLSVKFYTLRAKFGPSAREETKPSNGFPGRTSRQTPAIGVPLPWVHRWFDFWYHFRPYRRPTEVSLFEPPHRGRS